MKNFTLFGMIMSMLIGVIIGSIITGFTVVNSFQKDIDYYQTKICNYEMLMGRIYDDIPEYIDDVLSESDEWYEVYGDSY